MLRKRRFYLCLAAMVVCWLTIKFHKFTFKVDEVESFSPRPVPQSTKKYAQKYMEEPTQSAKVKDWRQEWDARLKKGKKIILFYTTWFGQSEWYDNIGSRLYETMEACSNAKNCLLTYEKSWLNQAAALVFHGRDVELNARYSPNELRKLRKSVPPSQKWIFLSHENPKKDVGIYKPYDGIFNWTATFSRTSDVFIPYQSYVPITPHAEELPNFAKEKTHLVAWVVSNCNSKLRLDYTLQLEKYLDVVVYGKCNRFFKNKGLCNIGAQTCAEDMQTYKFYLAFENDFCHDYVTEKYWQRIFQDVVPVVMGSNYDDGLVIPGSYIDVNDFSSIKQLAEYLLYLDKNDDAYNKYFMYKKRFACSSDSIYCKVCEKLNSDAGEKQSQVILSEAISYEKSCGFPSKKVEDLRKQIKESASTHK